MEEIKFHVDGASRGNGRPDAPSAFAVVFEHAGQYVYREAHYKVGLTSSSAELMALLRCLMMIQEADSIEALRNYSITISQDSSYAVNTYNSWMENWERKGIVEEKANSEIVKHLLELKKNIKKMGLSVKLFHVRRSSIPGNIEADRLCNEAMNRKESFVEYEVIPVS